MSARTDREILSWKRCGSGTWVPSSGPSRSSCWSSILLRKVRRTQCCRSATPFVTTLHGRLDLPEHQVVFATFPRSLRSRFRTLSGGPFPAPGGSAPFNHGLPERLLTPQPLTPAYFAFLGRISAEKAVDQAIWIAKRCGVPLKIAAKVDAVDRDYLESEIHKLLTHPHVENIGEIGDGEKSSFLSGAIALLAPIAWPQPLGLALSASM